jgi:hypothetical protein
MLSRRLKGKWSLWRRQGFHSTLLVLFTPSSLLRIALHLGIIFTHIHLYHWGESKKGSQKTPFLAINAKGKEILSPKQKDRTTTNFKVFKEVFNWHLMMKIFNRHISNWYLKYLIFFQLVKPS